MPYTCHVMSYTCHVISYTCHAMSYTYHVMPYTCHVMPYTCHVMPYTCHVMSYMCHNISHAFFALLIKVMQWHTQKYTMPHTYNAMSHTVVMYGCINMSIYVIHKSYKCHIMLCTFRQTIYLISALFGIVTHLLTIKKCFVHEHQRHTILN